MFNDPTLYDKLRDLGVYIEANNSLADAMNQAGARAVEYLRQRAPDANDDQIRQYVADGMKAVKQGDYAP